MPHDNDDDVLLNLQDRVEGLARMAVLIDSGDFPGLVALQEQATSLSTDLEGNHAGDIAKLAQEIGTLAATIVAGKAADANAAFNEIGGIIERMQTALNHIHEIPNDSSENESDADNKLIAIWVEDCESALTDLEGLLLALEKSPDNSEVIADIRRMMHTLKGECGVLSLNEAQQLCHQAESLIDSHIEAGLAVPVDPLLTLLDWLTTYVAKLSANHAAKPVDHEALLATLVAARLAIAPEINTAPQTEAQRCATPPSDSAIAIQAKDVVQSKDSAADIVPAPVVSPTERSTPVATTATSVAPVVAADTSPIFFVAQEGTEENLPDFLCEAKEHLGNSEAALLSLDQDRTNNELINTVFRAFHTIKGVAGFMALAPIVSLAHSAEQLLDGARSGTLLLGRSELDLILSSCDMMTRLLRVLEGSPGPTRHEFNKLVRTLDTAALTAGSGAPQQTAEQAANEQHEVAQASKTPEAEAAAPVESAPPHPEAEATSSPKTRKVDQTVKVNTTRMDSLVTMVGELVIAQQMVVQDLKESGNSQRIQRTLSHMGKMIRDLQEVSMSLRMVNLKGTFQKMTRLVRDVSQKADKQIEVITDGEDVELDRNVVEAITDPLVHMIRNACDHGIDSPEERRSLGKPPVGTVSLRAYHAGGSIVIEIADDGRGLRREKLLAKAKSKNLLPADLNEASMPDSEVFALIFLPGFSTAEKVTDISGRGVGMDVVRRNIEALRGKVEIRSTPGKGTTFMMRLPLTMAIIDGMVVRVGTQRYVLPTLSIQQSFRPRAEDVKTAAGVGEMVKVRGSMLPIYRLNRVLELNEGLSQITDALLIVMEADDSRFCLLVDEILGQHQVVIKTLNQTGQRLRGVSGGAILGDGRVALILDVPQIVALAREIPKNSRQTTGKANPIGVAAPEFTTKEY